MLEFSDTGDKEVDLTFVGFILLSVLSVIITASDFLLFIPFQIDLPLLLHVSVILFTLLCLAVAKFNLSKLVNKIVITLAFVVIFSVWVYQIVLNHVHDDLFLLGMILLVMWHSIQIPKSYYFSVPVIISAITVLFLFSKSAVQDLVFSAIILMFVVALGWWLSIRNKNILEYGNQSTSNEPIKEIGFDDMEEELFIESQPEIAMLNVAKDESSHDWELVLRDLYSELKDTPDIDRLFKKMLNSLSSSVEFDAAAVGMIQERTLNKITIEGSEQLLHPKCLNWTSDLLKKLNSKKEVLVNHQDYVEEDGTLIKLYRLDIPVLSNGKMLGVTTLLRTEALFNEYDSKLAGSIVFHSMIAFRHARLQEEVKKLTVDNTNKSIFTREQFIEKANLELDALDKPRIFSLFIVEIDNFESIIDKHQPDVASAVYKKVASVIMTSLSADDIMGRYGKEGFVVLVHETELLDAKKIAENIRIKIESTKHKIADGVLSVTVSIGLTTVSEPGEDMPTIIRKADMGLFVAKESGFNAVKVSL